MVGFVRVGLHVPVQSLLGPVYAMGQEEMDVGLHGPGLGLWFAIILDPSKEFSPWVDCPEGGQAPAVST